MSVDVKLNPRAPLKSPWEWYPAELNATQSNVTPMMLQGQQISKAGSEPISLKISSITIQIWYNMQVVAKMFAQGMTYVLLWQLQKQKVYWSEGPKIDNSLINFPLNLNFE